MPGLIDLLTVPKVALELTWNGARIEVQKIVLPEDRALGLPAVVQWLAVGEDDRTLACCGVWRWFCEDLCENAAHWYGDFDAGIIRWDC